MKKDMMKTSFSLENKWSVQTYLKCFDYSFRRGLINPGETRYFKLSILGWYRQF